MKKKLIVLSSIVMFSIGLALYANNSSAMKVLSEDNIEALSEGESSGNPIQETGTYPHRVWIDHEAHTITMEGIHREKNYAKQDECVEKRGYTCTLSTASPIYNAEEISDIILKFLKTIFSSTSFFSWVFSLFK